MRRVVAFVVAGLALIAVEASDVRADRSSQASQPRAGVRPAAQALPPATATPDDHALIQKYCATCHNDRAKTGGLSLQGLNPFETAVSHAATW